MNCTKRLVVCLVLLCAALPALAGDIHRAVEAGDLALVKQILKRDPGALTSRDNNRFREMPIHFAAASGNVDMMRLILDAGADIDAGDSDNSTALGIAAMRKHPEMVTFLIEHGADVNHRDRKADCPLSFAVYGKDETIIKQLVVAGADLWFRNPNGETLMHIAGMRGLIEFVTYLVDHGSDMEAKSSNGGTPLGFAAMGGQTEVVQLLLDRGANPNPASLEEVTPLIFTCWRNQVECARLLLANGATVNFADERGNTALQIATSHCSVEMVQLLIDHGADVNHTNQHGSTALINAASGGYNDRALALLKAKADPNRGTDEGGRTALQLAAAGGYVEMGRALVDAGADLNPSGMAESSPRQLALYYGHTELAGLLAENNGRSRRGGNVVDRSLAALGRIGRGEAVIWFLGHSGWAVKTRQHLLIFDYFPQGENPASAGLCNGRINPAEIADHRVAVFASHSHGDHYTPRIFEWKDQVGDISYFLGLQPRDSVPEYVFMPERLEGTYGDIKLTTIHSTDAGVGMLVEVDGVTIFHPGDHANGRLGLMDEFTDEIDFLAGRGIRTDICFMGIRGCSLGRPDEVKEGVEYTLKILEPKVFIPMHAGAQGHLYHEFIGGIQEAFPSVQMVAPDNRGDHFVFEDGRITDPKRINSRQARAD
jgi:ankyrin repeat protein